MARIVIETDQDVRSINIEFDTSGNPNVSTEPETLSTVTDYGDEGGEGDDLLEPMTFRHERTENQPPADTRESLDVIIPEIPQPASNSVQPLDIKLPEPEIDTGGESGMDMEEL